MGAYGPHESSCYRTDCLGRVCLSPEQHQQAWEKGETFYCSRGHGQVFTRTKQVTYRQLEDQVVDLRRQVQAYREEAAWGEQYSEDLRLEFATCPFEGCSQGGYHYARQRTLIAHLDREHGTDIGARISLALTEEVAHVRT